MLVVISIAISEHSDDNWPEPFCRAGLPSIELCKVDYAYQTKPVVLKLSLNPTYKHIKKLYFDTSTIISFPMGIFSTFNRVEDIRMQNCLVAQIPETVFSQADYLTKLDLQLNQLTALEAGVFTGADSLTDINLSSNEIVDIDERVFMKLNKLIILKLEHNHIDLLEENIFRNNRMLDILNLNGNQLEDIKFITPLSNLVYLGLNNNQIKNIKITYFQKLHRLTELYLKGNQLITFDFERFAPPLVSIFLINDNQLMEIPVNGLRNNFGHLAYFRFDGNSLTCKNVEEIEKYMRFEYDNNNNNKYIWENGYDDSIDWNGIKCFNGVRVSTAEEEMENPIKSNPTLPSYSEKFDLLRRGNLVSNDKTAFMKIVLPTIAISLLILIVAVIMIIKKTAPTKSIPSKRINTPPVAYECANDQVTSSAFRY